MNFRNSIVVYITLLLLIIPVIIFAKETDKDDSANKVLSIGYDSHVDNKYLSGYMEYSKYLTKSLYFTVNTNLRNTFNKKENYPTTLLGVSTSLDYNPDSPVSFGIDYSIQENDAEVKYAGTDIFDFKSYAYDTSLSADAGYRFTDNINTKFILNLRKYKFRSKVPGRSWNEGISDEKSISGNLSYNITDTTSIGLDMQYSKDLSDSYVDYQDGTDPVDYERVISDASQSSIIGSLSTSRTLGEDASINISTNLNFSKTTDAKTRINENNYMGANANLNLTYNIFPWMRFISSASYSHTKLDYLYNLERRLEMDDYLDVLNKIQDYSGKLEFDVFQNTTFFTQYKRRVSTPEYSLEGGFEIDPSEEQARDLKDSYSDKFLFNLKSSLTNKLTFQFENVINSSRTYYRVRSDLNNRIIDIDLNSTLTYEMSLVTNFTIKPIMSLKLDNPEDDPDHERIINYSLDMTAFHTMMDVVDLTLSYYIKQYKKLDADNEVKNLELIRRLNSNLKFNFSSIVKPSFNSRITWSAYSDKYSYSYVFSPTVEIYPSKNLSIDSKLDIRYSQNDYKDESETDTSDIDFTSNISMTYIISQGLRFSVSFDSTSHRGSVDLTYTF
jgi:hypothetical protein